MVFYCVVKNCKNVWFPNSKLSYHRFPWSDKDYLDQWLNVVPAKNHIGKYSYICSAHFKDSDFERDKFRRILKKNAVPSQFDYNVLHIETRSNERRNFDLPSTSSSTNTSIDTSSSNVKSSTNLNLTSFPVSPNASIIDYAETVNLDENTQMITMSNNSEYFSSEENNYIKLKMKDAATQMTDYDKLPTEKEIEMRRKIKILQSRLHRRELKLKNMVQVIDLLKKKGKCTDQLETVLLRQFSKLNIQDYVKNESENNCKIKSNITFAHIANNEINNNEKSKTRYRYTEKIKEFASTVHFYSPKAYEYLRTILHLPDSSVLRKIIREASCEAGFVNSVFDFLKAEKMRSDYVHDVGLIFDAMSIRNSVSVDQKENKFRGTVDYGNVTENITYNASEQAKEMLAFQVVSYSTKFKMPIAHFFISRIDAQTQAKLIIEAIKRLYNVGIVVRSITCDGAQVNISTLEILGCNFQFYKHGKPKTFFKHPLNNSNIYVIMDPCHMLKLCRNTFADTEMVSSTGIISFKYVRDLHYHQQEIGLKYANKLSTVHIFFQNKKMKVNLATQTISSGVADAIEYLKQAGHPQFCNSEATIEFIRIFDRLFDIMNTRSVYGKGYKSPLMLQNKDYWMNVFKTSENYIKNLKLNGRFVMDSKRKTFALGFIINIHSLEGLVIDLLSNITKPLKYFLTYKISQDHIELYFCCIRSRGGWNNNPSVMQALWSIRRLLFQNSITSSKNANCSHDDYNNNPIFKFRSKKRDINLNSSIKEAEEKDDDINLVQLLQALQNVELNIYQENILYYIAGSIVKKFLDKCICIHCRQLVLYVSNEDHNYAVPNFNHYSGFLNVVNRGKLYEPSKAILEIIKFSEKSFKAQLNITGQSNSIKLRDMICSAAVKYFSSQVSTMFYPPHPITETIDDWNELHELKIIKQFTTAYIKIRLNAYAKMKTLELLGSKATIRQKLNRVVIFSNV